MTRGARKEGLSRRYRFVGRGSFTAALRSPRKIRSAAIVLHVAPGRAGESRFGLATTKRLTRRAVDRNRIKRVLREVFRRHGAKQAGLDLVLVPREAFTRGSEEGWIEQARKLLDRAAEE